jgi:hypothetical protein
MMTMDAESASRAGPRYWLIVLILVGLGFLTIFSIGMYFWFIAIAMTVLSPYRSRPRIFRTGIALFLGFLLGYVLTAPWGCSQSFTSDPTTGEETMSPIVCTSPVGIEYSGSEPFDPSRTPALVAGAATAVIASAVTWLLAAPKNLNPETMGDRLRSN